jgi:DNA-directed RNA polymerase specialized sigma24 family protein
MFDDESFNDVMQRLRGGDDPAETMVFRRFVRRLIVLASKQFDARMRDRADVENVVLSAFKSFFIRNGRGDFLLADWGELWSILAVITLRKCDKRIRHLKAARRDAGREVTLMEAGGPEAWLADRAPTPVEAAILTETVDCLFQSMAPQDRPIIEQILMGYTADEVAARLDCSERTVRRVRQRAKNRLLKLIEAGKTDAEIT